MEKNRTYAFRDLQLMQWLGATIVVKIGLLSNMPFELIDDEDRDRRAQVIEEFALEDARRFIVVKI